MKTLPFAFCAYFLGVRDPRFPGEERKLIVIEPGGEYTHIEESLFLIGSGDLLEP